jgi:hypothetical protein
MQMAVKMWPRPAARLLLQLLLLVALLAVPAQRALSIRCHP